MSDLPETCPRCGTAVRDAAGIGPFCPNKSCDALDDLRPTGSTRLWPFHTLVDRPRPTTPVVDHEGGESERQDEAKARRAKAMDELIAQSADEIFTPLESKLYTRISELEAEVERLKEDVSRQMEIANSECEHAEAVEKSLSDLADQFMRVKMEKDAATKTLADERETCAKVAEGGSPEFDFQAALAEHRDCEHGFHSGRIAAAAAIRARSTAMNKGGE